MGVPMNSEDLKNKDDSIQIIQESNPQQEFLGITDAVLKKPQHLFFVKNKNFLSEIIDSEELKNLALIVEEKYFNLLDTATVDKLKSAKFLATSKDVMLTMCKLSEVFHQKIFSDADNFLDGRQLGNVEIDPTAMIAQGVFIGSRVKIGANVKIHSGVTIQSDVEIQDGTVLFNNVSIYSMTKIGKNVRIHAGSVIGADGFGYHFSAGTHHKIWHMGGVEIKDNVEIGANSCVDMGTFSPTTIGAGSKIDNQVQVGHNVKLGNGVVLCGQVAVGGSTTIGDFTVAGGQAGFGNGLKIGKGVQLAGASGAVSNVGDGETVGGFPARDHKEWLKSLAMLRKLALNKKEEK